MTEQATTRARASGQAAVRAVETEGDKTGPDTSSYVIARGTVFES
jgi:hypothetical protein